jgi:hypothetical protein
VPTSVFVSYRRDDSKHAAGRLGERLDERFTLFMDVDSIRPGTDFTAVVREAVEQADVLLALIGPTWLTAADETGARRLDNPEDWVVAEIGTALEHGTPVVPVLVDGARMPQRQDLPPSLAPLASRQALTLSHESFATDCTRVIDTIEDLSGFQQPRAVDLWADPDYPAARSALLQGQWARAIEGLERVHRRHPRQREVIEQLEDARQRLDLEGLEARASSASSDGRWGDAVEALEAIVAVDVTEEVVARLAEARQRHRIDNLQHDIRAFANVGDWAAVVAADAELFALDPDAADVDGLATLARERLLESVLDADYRRGVQQLASEDWAGGEATFAAIVQQRADYRDAVALLDVARRQGRPAETPVPATVAEPAVASRTPVVTAPLPVPEPEPEPEPVEQTGSPGRPSFSSRGWLAIGVAAVVLVGAVVVGTMLMGDDEDPGAGPSDTTTTSSNEPSASASPGTPATPPPATGTELVSAPELRPARAAGTFAMAGSNGGVRIKGLEEVQQYGTGDAVRTPPEGGRLVAFQLTDWACGEPCTTKWPTLDLRVRVGEDSRRLPDDQGTYVVAVPAGTTALDLTMRTDGYPQSLSLLTGEPGDDNLAVLARPDREASINEEFGLTETLSEPVDFCLENGPPVSSLERDVVVRSASLDFFVGTMEAASPKTALLVVNASFTLACRPGERFPFKTEEIAFRGNDGVARQPLEPADDVAGLAKVFRVPANLTGGTLLLGGTRVAYPGTADEFTATVEDREVPFRF